MEKKENNPEKKDPKKDSVKDSVKENRVIMIILSVIIFILLVLLLFQYFGKDENKTETTETEQVQPENKESEASKDLEEDLKGLKNSEEDTKTTELEKPKKEEKTVKKVEKDKPGKSATQIQGAIFNYQGKPDLSFVKHDFGVYLTKVTADGNTYVPIKFITKKYISKLAPQVAGLEKDAVPKTDKENPEGRPPGKNWNLDKSGTVYYFVDFGQKVKKVSSDNTVQIPLNAYAGKKPGGYEIWLMYEAAVLNKQGFTQSWDGGKFVPNGFGGYDFGAYFKGYRRF